MPGIGLLLLRATLGITLLVQGGASLINQKSQAVWIWAFGLLAITGGILLLIGFLTPLISLSTLLNAVGAVFSLFPFTVRNSPESGLAVIYLMIMAVVLVLLGPGAFSLDARVFGRREIFIPHNPHKPKL